VTRLTRATAAEIDRVDVAKLAEAIRRWCRIVGHPNYSLPTPLEQQAAAGLLGAVDTLDPALGQGYIVRVIARAMLAAGAELEVENG